MEFFGLEIDGMLLGAKKGQPFVDPCQGLIGEELEKCKKGKKGSISGTVCW